METYDVGTCHMGTYGVGTCYIGSNIVWEYQLLWEPIVWEPIVWEPIVWEPIVWEQQLVWEPRYGL